MAIYYARKNGNVNAADVWATTPAGTAGNYFSSFTNADTLVSNSFTITLNVNTTVLEIRNDTTGGATAGGGFTLNDGIILTSNVVGNTAAGATILCSYNGLSPNSATIVGNITGGIAYTTVNNGNTGTLTIIGNIVGALTSGGAAVYNYIGTLNITGNISTSLVTGSEGVRDNGVGTTNITGNIVGGYLGAASTGVNHYSGGGTLNITGTVTGGISGPGVTNNTTGTVNIVGTAIGGVGAAGVNNASTGTLIVARAKGNGFGPGSVGLNSVVGVAASQNGSTKVYEIEYGPLGQSPTSGPIELIGATSNVAVFAVRLSTPKTLVDLNNATNLVPSSGNVRSGISYNYGNNTGSCVIPNPNSVVYGVPVDNVTGSGLLSPVAVWNALTSSIGTSGSIGERLKNCSTVATVGKQLEGVL